MVAETQPPGNSPAYLAGLNVMPLASHPHQAALATFIASLADVPWLSSAGDPDDTAIVAEDLVDAWDGWNSEMMAVWSPRTHRLERAALERIGEDGLSTVFESVSNATGDPLAEAMQRYFDTRSKDGTNTDRGLGPEWLDAMKRDLCWAAIEAVLDRRGFFTHLLRYYRAGRWPCAWEDGDHHKRVVLL